jgi:hypothetical protein
MLRAVIPEDRRIVMTRRAQHGPTDSVLSRLYAATGGSRYVDSVKQELLFSLLPRVSNPRHRAFFSSTFERIERAGDNRIELDRIRGEIDGFVDQEFLGR